MLRYGNFKVPTVGKPKHSTILQRIEELKKMYQNATQEEGNIAACFLYVN